MALAIATGIPHTVWLDDPHAMVTAVQLLDEMNKQRRR